MRRGLLGLGGAALLALAPAAGCRVPAPEPVRRPVPARPASVTAETPRWFEAEGDDAAEASPHVIVPRRPENEGSPLGANLPPLDSNARYVAFTDRFLHAAPWRAEGWDGGPSSEPLALDAQGWVRRLARDQVAVTSVPTRPGGRYVVSHEGDGRLEIEDAEAVRRIGPRRFEITAAGGQIELRVERTSPSAPLRSIRVLPARWADAREVPLFEPRFLDRLAPFSVIRFAGWSRVGRGAPSTWAARVKPDAASQAGPGGVAWEHALDLARQLSAEPWLSVPFGADDAYVRSLAELVKARLDPALRVFVELGDEAWRADERGPGAKRFARAAARRALDPDPAVARLLYQAARSAEIFALFEDVLGPGRAVRVVSAPVGAPRAVELLLGQRELSRRMDAVAVAPRLELRRPRGADDALARLERRVLPEAIGELRRVARVTSERGVDLVAYAGGLEPSAADAPAQPDLAVLTLALLDAWKAAGGQTFVASPLFGPGRPLPALSTAPDRAPRYAALLRFAVNAPRWWKRRAPPPEAPSAPEPAPTEPEPEAQVAETPPPPKLYTAPWVKWASLGVGAALGGLATERFLAAEDFADRRDEGLDSLSAVSDRAAFDRLQSDVRQAESDRALAQGLGFAAVGIASALVGWAIAQWLEEPPEPEVVLPPWAEGARGGGGP